MTYIALLKGINVGSVKKIKMTDLAALASGLGFQDVKTYLQSGNLVFKTEGTKPDAVRIELEKAIEKKFGFEVSVVIRTGKEMKRALEQNPFPRYKTIAGDKMFITFLEKEPVSLPRDMKKTPSEDYRLVGKEVYLYCPDGYGRTKLNNQTFEKEFGMTATTRNWNTVVALGEMAEQ
jgi:uncharacterized protein (DUF1697 family)